MHASHIKQAVVGTVATLAVIFVLNQIGATRKLVQKALVG